MPVPTQELTATIGFTLPPSRLPEGDTEESYHSWVQGRSKPLEQVRVPMTNLRSELDRPLKEHATPLKQLKSRGFAVFKHQSEHVGEIHTAEGNERYLAETSELLKSIVGCDKVIAWNSVVRRNHAAVKEKIVEKQKGPEKNHVPTERTQPPAGLAHVDQNAEWGFELCGKAAGKPAGEYKRCQIINLWRPLHGPVTNCPLAMLDPKFLAEGDIGTHASQFGLGLDIHHSEGQRWAYVRHQRADEPILLKCYDTDQGKNGEVLYCCHTAAQVDNDEEGIAPELIRPRESVEVRLVALWE